MSRTQPSAGDEYEAYIPKSELRSYINRDRSHTLVWSPETMLRDPPRDLEASDIVKVKITVEEVGLD